jgi:hypothetical protein
MIVIPSEVREARNLLFALARRIKLRNVKPRL